MRVPIPINEAEAIIEPFWDQRISPLDRYEVIPGSAEEAEAIHLKAGGTSATLPGGDLDAAGRAADGGTHAAANPWGVRAFQFWCWTTLAWDRAPAGAPVLSFVGRPDADLRGYDRLIVRLAAPSHVRLTVTAHIDGRRLTLVDGEPGRVDAHEYEAPVAGRVLEHIALTLQSASERSEEVWLGWIGCGNAARRAAMLGRPNPFDARWEGELAPEGAAVEGVPRFGFFFDAGELEAVRRRARSPLYRPIMDQLRARVREAMADARTPEGQIGPLHSTSVWKSLIREREYGYRAFFIDAPIVAFVGLVDADPAISRFAARIALSLAHIERWQYTFMQGFPGSTWDIRGFPETFTAASVALVADWAGAWLTEKAVHLLRVAVATKGMPKARQTLLAWEYLWSCNQSHMMSLGRILGLLLMERAWPRARDDIAQFGRDIVEMIERYVQPDGSTDEGVGYWSNTFRATLPAVAALARRDGRSLPQAMHPRLASTWSFIGSLLSTVGDPGSYLPIADTVGNRISLDAIAMMAAGLAGPWSELLAACLRAGRRLNLDWAPDGLFAIIFGPEEEVVPAAPCLRPSTFSRLATAGMVSSCRGWPAGGEPHGFVRLFLVGAMANAGHSHRDKGSFILEACGETFAADRGMTPYEDAENVPFLKSEEAHNLAVPEGCFQRNPSPVASAWNGEGDEQRLEAAIVTTGTWLAPVLSCRRAVSSPRPDLIELTDEIELAEPRSVFWYLHTPLAAEAGEHGARVTGASAVLEVRADWAREARIEACGVNGDYVPFRRLVLVSAPGTSHRLRTVLALSPVQRPADRVGSPR